MRIHAIALAALLTAGCSASDEEANALPVADSPAPAQSAPPEPAPASGDEDDTHLVPKRFQGDYAADTPAYTTPAHESRLTIGAWRIKFPESSDRKSTRLNSRH